MSGLISGVEFNINLTYSFKSFGMQVRLGYFPCFNSLAKRLNAPKSLLNTFNGFPPTACREYINTPSPKKKVLNEL